MQTSQKTKDILTLFTIYAILYKSANFIFLGEPTEIKATAVDSFWSFNPHWIWIYLSSFITLPISYFIWFYEKREGFIKSFMILTVVSFLIFVSYPTYIPRKDYLPDQMFILYEYVFKFLHVADGITNCLPSLHVSTAYFMAWWMWDVRKKLFPYFFVYATSVAISTMTVKQHYFYDALAGFVLSLLICGGWKIYEKKRGMISPS